MEFYDLDAWKKSHELVLKIYLAIKTFPREEMFGISDQMRRASSSITANIAEGYGRYHYPDKIKFLFQARGSVKEIQSFLILAKDLGYIKLESYKEIFELSIESEKLINGLIKYFETKKV